jgi:hypothetical protein
MKKRGKSYFYASHRGSQKNQLHRFYFRASRDKFVAEDPDHREAVPGRSPMVRLAKRLEEAHQVQWPFEYQD